MKKIVLLRHGESAWNKENRFTGWTDVDLTEKGVAEAEKAGVTLREYGFNFDKAYTSYLKRAVKTLNCVLDKMNLDWIPVEKSWRLNEKHYGDLQGLNKAETAGNSLRGIIKHLKHISDEDIIKLNLPTAVPYVFEFDENQNVSNDYFLGNPEEIRKLMEAVANQGKKK